MPPPKHPSAHRPLPRVLVLLTGAIALVELALTLADIGVIGSPTLRLRAFSLGAFWSPLLRGGEPIFALQPATMFVSHAFLHGGMLHMVMNMTILLAMGRLVADNYGPRAILPIFLAGATAGGAFFGLLSNEPIPMVGASGAVFAFLGVLGRLGLGAASARRRACRASGDSGRGSRRTECRVLLRARRTPCLGGASGRLPGWPGLWGMAGASAAGQPKSCAPTI